MKKVLLIVAAGKASRFGGFPKAFVQINGKMNIENTIRYAQGTYEKIYVAVNEETYGEYENIVKDCKMFGIETGNGEAHSLLKSLKYLKKTEPDVKRVTVCWGDAHFINDIPFKDIVKYEEKYLKAESVTVFCAIDEKPYAWFEEEDGSIKKIHFANEDGYVNEGIHDQSIFLFDVDQSIGYLEEYKEMLGIPDAFVEGKEMRLLRSFEFLDKSDRYPSARCAMIQGGNVFAFNTKEEVEKIEKMTKQDKNMETIDA